MDGRTARFDADRQGRRPWALWAPPEGPAQDVVLTDADTPTGVRAYAADGSLLWEQDGHHSPRHPRTERPRRVTPSGGTALPPAFWYLLRTRDPSGSRALRTLRRETADTLLTTARTDPATLRTTVARELPEITAPPLAEAEAAIAERAARVEDRRLELHR
ncbi:hypothetical protein [Streptomyces sp. NPDC002176]|uniref:hypothetical protein n=1 Tax=Streptomyces sp. NPDC002176 TaxID=3364634 RepID=UPI0038500B8A